MAVECRSYHCNQSRLSAPPIASQSRWFRIYFEYHPAERTSLQMERTCACCREQPCSWPDGLPRMAGLRVAGIRCAMHAPGSDASCRCAASTPPTPLFRRQSFQAPCNRRRSCMHSNASLGGLGPACAVRRTAGFDLAAQTGRAATNPNQHSFHIHIRAPAVHSQGLAVQACYDNVGLSSSMPRDMDGQPR